MHRIRCPPDKPVAKDDSENAWRRAAREAVDSYEAFGCHRDLAPREPLAPLLKNPRDTLYGRQIHMSVHRQKTPDEVRVEILCSELRACEEQRARERAERERERAAERAHRVRTEKVMSGLVGLCIAQDRL
tara:strand:- start:219 stop:611 length:393 start_codon:yes stop_codon:yes gene_type:complete